MSGGVYKVYHKNYKTLILDGRDVAGDSSPYFIDWLEKRLNKYNIGRINSIRGRAWGKDRDNRCVLNKKRTTKIYRVLITYKHLAHCNCRWKRIESAFRSYTEGTAALHVRLGESTQWLRLIELWKL